MADAGLMRGKRGLIMGVANNRSIAWGIAKAARAHGADLAFTYQGDALKKRVEPLAEEVDGLVVGHCDVTDEASLDAAFAAVKSAWGSLDFVLHAIAFSDKDQLIGRYVDTPAENFTNTLVLFVHRGRATRREDDAEWRLAADPHVLRRRKVDAALQRDGRCQGRTRSIGDVSRGRPWREKHSRQRDLGRADQDARGGRHRR